MEKLEELVDELVQESNGESTEESTEKKQIKTLQDIGKLLLTEYIIQVGDIKVYPLWVEAYYFNDKKFPDPFVYKDGKQKENDVLFFHHKTDDQRNGVDICLSKGNYYLSFLLKYTLVDDKVRKQSELSPLIRGKYEDDKYEDGKSVLIQESRPTDKISFTTRIGLSESNETNAEKKALKEKFKKYKLSVVRDFDKLFITDFKFPQKENLVKEYLSKQTEMSQSEKADFCKNALGYYLKEYKN